MSALASILALSVRFACTDNFVGVFLKLGNAHAQSIKFITELGGEAVKFGFV